MLVLREQMPLTERKRQDTSIFEQLFADELWQEIEWFYPFVSYGTEVDTIRMIEHVLAGKAASHPVHVAVPRVAGREMDFYEITSMDDLEPGTRGILEPKANCSGVIAGKGLMLMPGLAFDRELNRIGYGGGYYDKYLALHKNQELMTYAVAYDFQVVECLEADEYDIRPQKLIIGGACKGLWIVQ